MAGDRPRPDAKADELTKLTEACRDDAEVLALSVLRFVAAGYMTGDTECWDMAHRGAEQVLGASEGPVFVARMVGVMRAIRAERVGNWNFLPALCCRVTADERRLLALLALARSGPSSVDALASGAAGLAGTAGAPQLAQALRLSAGALDAAQARIVATERGESRPPPVLH
jgi:hypothetical protein